MDSHMLPSAHCGIKMLGTAHYGLKTQNSDPDIGCLHFTIYIL